MNICLLFIKMYVIMKKMYAEKQHGQRRKIGESDGLYPKIH